MSSNMSIGGAESQHRLDRIETLSPSEKKQNEFPQSSKMSKESTSEAGKKLKVNGDSIPISNDQLVKAIERAIKSIQGPTTSLDFSVHKDTKQIMVKVLDKETGEVLREVPPEKNQDLLAKLWEMAGILVDEKR